MRSEDQSPDENQQGSPELSPQDQLAVDRIFESDPEAFVAQSERDHAILNLFNLLDSPVQGEAQRSARTDLIQVLAARLESSDLSASLELSPEDQMALDQYIEREYQADRVDTQLQSRAQRCDQLGVVLTGAGEGALASGDLVDRTLTTIQEHIDKEEAAMRTSWGRGINLSGRWADLVSVAAMLLIVGSIAMPIMSGVRSKSQQSLCLDHMNSSANAFGLYAGSNRDMLPMATAGFGPTWIDVGTTPERSNSSNLYTLIRTQNADLDDLACPSNANAATGDADPEAWDWNSLQEISYSYRIMPPGGMRATTPTQPVRVVLLADRSPVVLRVVRGESIVPEENSPNHSGQGQHMLMLDGGAQWETSPIINDQDNIWLPRPIERVIQQVRSKLGIIKGSELPAGPTDGFVGP